MKKSITQICDIKINIDLCFPEDIERIVPVHFDDVLEGIEAFVRPIGEIESINEKESRVALAEEKIHRIAAAIWRRIHDFQKERFLYGVARAFIKIGEFKRARALIDKYLGDFNPLSEDFILVDLHIKTESKGDSDLITLKKEYISGAAAKAVDLDRAKKLSEIKDKNLNFVGAYKKTLGAGKLAVLFIFILGFCLAGIFAGWYFFSLKDPLQSVFYGAMSVAPLLLFVVLFVVAGKKKKKIREVYPSYDVKMPESGDRKRLGLGIISRLKVLVAAAMVIVIVAGGAVFATSFISAQNNHPYFSYRYNIQGNVVITAYNGSEEAIVIPETIDRRHVVALSSINNPFVKEITLSLSASQISPNAFDSSPNLQKITIKREDFQSFRSGFPDLKALFYFEPDSGKRIVFFESLTDEELTPFEGLVTDDIVLPSVTREGFVFDGWLLENGEPFCQSLGFTSIRVFARWQSLTYQVTLDPKNGETPKTIEVNFASPMPAA
ncbi:MAG: hypothetical protein FWD86_03470, partial [Firmicutes bacterium]|nr:hypothetical protein [Bacillota bacterium]